MHRRHPQKNHSKTQKNLRLHSGNAQPQTARQLFLNIRHVLRVLIHLTAEYHERQPLEQLRSLLVLLLSRREQTETAALRHGHAAHQISERRVVVRHQIVDDYFPVFQARIVHLEKRVVEQEVVHVFLPRFSRVLVAAEAC